MTWIERLRQISLQEVLSGNILNRGFFRRQYKLILLVAFLSFIYIYAGFVADNQQRRIQRLEKDITEAHYELLDVSQKYTLMTRPSSIAERLRHYGSNIGEAEQPPISFQ